MTELGKLEASHDISRRERIADVLIRIGTILTTYGLSLVNDHTPPVDLPNKDVTDQQDTL